MERSIVVLIKSKKIEKNNEQNRSYIIYLIVLEHVV